MNKIFRVTTIVFAFFLTIAQGHAAEVIWEGDFSRFAYTVEPNGGAFLTLQPSFQYDEADDVESYSYDEIYGGMGSLTVLHQEA